MVLLFLGFTLLLAQMFFFSVGGVQDTVMLIIKWGRISTVLPYFVAAVLTGAFIYFAELPHRLPHPIPGRGFLLAGLFVHVPYLLVLHVGVPLVDGAVYALALVRYFPSLATALILIGSVKALLSAKPTAPTPSTSPSGR